MTTLALLSALQNLPTAAPASASWQAEAPSALVARARDVVDRLVSGEVEPVVGMFNDKMKAAIDAARLRGLMPGVAVQAGAFKSQTGARSEVLGGAQRPAPLARLTSASADAAARPRRSAHGAKAGAIARSHRY